MALLPWRVTIHPSDRLLSQHFSKDTNKSESATGGGGLKSSNRTTLNGNTGPTGLTWKTHLVEFPSNVLRQWANRGAQVPSVPSADHKMTRPLFLDLRKLPRAWFEDYLIGTQQTRSFRSFSQHKITGSTEAVSGTMATRWSSPGVTYSERSMHKCTILLMLATLAKIEPSTWREDSFGGQNATRRTRVHTHVWH